MSIWKAISTSFIQKINVFDQQAEEGDHNLWREMTSLLSFQFSIFSAWTKNSIRREEKKEILTFQCAMHLESSTVTGKQKGSRA